MRNMKGVRQRTQFDKRGNGPLKFYLYKKMKNNNFNNNFIQDNKNWNFTIVILISIFNLFSSSIRIEEDF